MKVMASSVIGTGNSSQPRLFLEKHAHRVRNWALTTGGLYLVILLGLVFWIIDRTGIGVFGLSEFGSVVVEWIFAGVGSAVVVCILVSKLYFAPRSAAYNGNA
ncbi:MAG: hypothetical protein WA738_21405, partial [Candidatus Angelobacter sp.]